MAMKNQLNLFDKALPYKYIIDTCAILAQKTNDKYPRNRFKTLWKNIDDLIKKSVIVVSSEIYTEVADPEIQQVLKTNNCVKLDVNEFIQKNVSDVLSKKPRLIDFNQNKSSGDAFLVATAMEYGLIVITEENPDKQYKIPKVCEAVDVKCVNLIGLMDAEDWEF